MKKKTTKTKSPEKKAPAKKQAKKTSEKKQTPKAKSEPDKPKLIKPIKSGVLCIGCKADIPKQRLAACPGTTTCVSCSNVKTKKPIIVQQGVKDHTYIETIIVDADVYEKYISIEHMERKRLGIDINNDKDEKEPKKE